jgi:hypothetical protein
MGTVQYPKNIREFINTTVHRKSVATNVRTSDVARILLAHNKASADSHETLTVMAGYFGTEDMVDVSRDTYKAG